MNSFYDIKNQNNLALKEQTSHLEWQALYREFLKIKDVGFDKYVNLYKNRISLNEQLILSFLHFVYNDSLSTIKIYLITLCGFTNYINVDLRTIHAYHIKNYIELLKIDKYSSATINNRIACLKSFYNHLISVGLINNNPASIIKMHKGDNNRFADKVLNGDDIHNLLDYAKKNADVRDYVLTAFLYKTGVRVAELVSLTWGDIFADTQSRYFVRVKGKGSKERDVYLPKDLYSDLMFYCSFQYNIPIDQKAPGLKNMPIFPSRRKLTRQLTTYSVYRIIKRLGKKALGMDKISPHWLRHSFATHARLKGATLEGIKQQLGHNKYDTTLLYEHGAHLSDPAGAVFDQD